MPKRQTPFTERIQFRHPVNFALFLLPLFLVALAVTWLGLSAGTDSATFSPDAPRFRIAGGFNPGSDDLAGPYDYRRDPAVRPLTGAARPRAVADDCEQLLANPGLDVVNSSIPSWSILEPKVYYSTQNYVSPPSSVVLPDGDDDDPSPTEDAFGQFFTMPSNLTRVTIEFHTGTVDANGTDKAFGNLWTVDAGNQPDKFIGGWQVTDSANAWASRDVVVSDSGDLADMAGQKMVIILFTDTDGQDPGEVVYFDDITLTACTGSANTPTATATTGPSPTPSLTPTGQPPAGRKQFLPAIFNPAAPVQPTPTPTSSPVAPTPPPGDCPQTGQWSGTTSQGRPISFMVENESRCQIGAESLRIQIRDSCGFVTTTTFMQSYPIVNNRFQTGSWDPMLNWVGGKFASSNTASGYFNFYSINPYEPWRWCIADGEWTATP